jgi:hypothetical protein
LDRRLGGPQSGSGRGGEEKNYQYRESNPRTTIVQPVAQRYTYTYKTKEIELPFKNHPCALYDEMEIGISKMEPI